MRAFKWNRSNAVHLPEIDAEHRAIYRSAADLQHAAEAGAPPDRILEILNTLSGAVEDHFTHEERLMQSTRYSGYAWHRQQHDATRKRIAHFIAQAEAGAPQSAGQALEYLSGWLRNHTSVADSMMGAYLRNYIRSHVA